MPDVASSSVVSDDQISLTMPARPRYNKVVRVAAANLAMRLGWSLIEIDELRTVVDEASLMLVGPVPSKARLETCFMPGDDQDLAIELAMSGDVDGTIPTGRVEHFREVVAPLVDELSVDADGRSVSLRKAKRS